MNLTNAIKLRQANREFNKTPLTSEEVEQLTDAAGYAPVARGRFNDFLITVVNDPATIDILEADDTGHPFYGAPTVIMISTTLVGQSGFLSAGMIAENIELKATDLGLATCTILGVVKASIEESEAALNSLGLPDDFHPVLAVAVGHPVHELKPRNFVTNRLRTVTINPENK
ncbi:MAG TPA: nitroreductase family protein [Candidatus Limosilactobacillus faecipullorum]|nr:nitroreductase family protein [Candidatus Limosilactobacillus faecipullorum]